MGTIKLYHILSRRIRRTINCAPRQRLFAAELQPPVVIMRQRCRELRADWELQCVIRSARERPRARVPVMCGSWILVSLPVWSLSAIWRGFQKLLPIACISFLDGLQPIQTHCKHRISNCSAHFQLPVELYTFGRPATVWCMHLGAGRLHRAAPCTEGAGPCSAPSCTGT